jgi:23S rRNA pseudouridine1911/1915/1917 synthase
MVSADMSEMSEDGVRGGSARRDSAGPELREADIIYEDNHLIAVCKKISEIVQGDRTGDEPLSERVKRFLKQRDRKPGNVFLGVCHRLDRPTSGVVVFAKTGKTLKRMNELFRTGGVHKTYWAVVESPPAQEQGTLTDYLVRNSKKNKSYITTEAEDAAGAKRAELEYRLAGRSDRYFLLEVTPQTGRHHQIRAQLAAAGCRIKGDLKYGARRSNPGGGIHLHALRISFRHPVGSGEEVVIEAPPPAEDRLWAFFVQDETV